jgi:chemotaxis methyl-accepting protein methylase
MEDKSCIAFLQWALPRLHLRWHGFRRVRRQVCRRIDQRIAALKLDSVKSYSFYLENFELKDIRGQSPAEKVHLLFWRNLAFTYFDSSLQDLVFRKLRDAIEQGGALILGKHETIPPGASGFAPWAGGLPVYRKL